MVNDALSKAFVAVANAPRSMFSVLGFDNLLNDLDTALRYQKIYFSNGIMIEYSNPKNALGYAIYDDNYLYVFSSSNSSIEIKNCLIPQVSEGHFDSFGEWQSNGNINLVNNSLLNVEANKVYRLRISNISQLPSSSDLKNMGYKTIIDSIRG